MNWFFIAAAMTVFVTGVVHSVVGERLRSRHPGWAALLATAVLTGYGM